jgi:hypothetical protein
MYAPSFAFTSSDVVERSSDRAMLGKSLPIVRLTTF